MAVDHHLLAPLHAMSRNDAGLLTDSLLYFVKREAEMVAKAAQVPRTSTSASDESRQCQHFKSGSSEWSARQNALSASPRANCSSSL